MSLHEIYDYDGADRAFAHNTRKKSARDKIRDNNHRQSINVKQAAADKRQRKAEAAAAAGIDTRSKAQIAHAIKIERTARQIVKAFGQVAVHGHAIVASDWFTLLNQVMVDANIVKPLPSGERATDPTKQAGRNKHRHGKRQELVMSAIAWAVDNDMLSLERVKDGRGKFVDELIVLSLPRLVSTEPNATFDEPVVVVTDKFTAQESDDSTFVPELDDQLIGLLTGHQVSQCHRWGEPI